MHRLFRTFIFTWFCCSLLFACAHTPQNSEATSEKTTKTPFTSKKGEKIADLAESLLGSPYKYGGASPKGFDCSGLVHYTHGKLGIRTPRTSLQQYKHAKHIKLSELTLGDIVFFTLNKHSVSHVGIYVGNNRFIHAPKSGKQVTMNNLNDEYWRPRVVGAGRLY
jgi:cell wall-associated NlpC family hydrolase